MIGDFTMSAAQIAVNILVAMLTGYALGIRDGRRGRWFRIVWGRRLRRRNTSQ